MLALGIDPDTKDPSFALWGDDGPLTAWVAHVVGSSKNYRVLDTLAKMSNDATLTKMFADLVLYGDEDLEVVAIEGQQVDKRTRNVQDIFKLAHVTGMLAMLVRLECSCAKVLIPTPHEWKKSVAKHAMQARLYKSLGWGYEIIGSKASQYARPLNVPIGFQHITPGQWKHVGDALLLAKWAHTTHQNG